MHSAKASRQSSGFHGKLITILRPFITSSLSIRQRNLLFAPFLLLSHPLCQNKPPKTLRPGPCLCLAPFHHNYTAEQNQAPCTWKSSSDLRLLFHNRLQASITLLERDGWSPCISLHRHSWEIHFPLLILLCPSHLGVFSRDLGGSKSKKKNRKKGAALRWTSWEKISHLCGLSLYRISCLYPFLPANSTRETLFLPDVRLGSFLAKEQGSHQLPLYLALHAAYLMEKNKWFTIGTRTWEKTWNKSVHPSIQIFKEKNLFSTE